MRYVILAIVLLVACGDNTIQPDASMEVDAVVQPPDGPADCTIKAGSLGEAYEAVAVSACKYLARCTGAQESACAASETVHAQVCAYCRGLQATPGSYPCDDPYTSWDALNVCLADYDMKKCEPFGPPPACPL